MRRRRVAVGGSRRSSPQASITVLAALFAFLLHYLLGEEVVARHALVSVLVPTLVANLVLALPVHALVRAVVHERGRRWRRDRRSRSLSDGAYQERRSPSERFLPPDPRVREPYRLTPPLALRVGILGAVALILFALLFLRLWSLQVLSGDEYLNAAQNNQLRLVRLEAPRGSILDRRGRTIVSNVAGHRRPALGRGHAGRRTRRASCAGSRGCSTSRRAGSPARSTSTRTTP